MITKELMQFHFVHKIKLNFKFTKNDLSSTITNAYSAEESWPNIKSLLKFYKSYNLCCSTPCIVGEINNVVIKLNFKNINSQKFIYPQLSTGCIILIKFAHV